jgi:hypothetical protein
VAGRQAEAKHELTALFSRETGQKDKAQSVRAMYIETAETKYLLLLKPCTTPALPTRMGQTRDCEHVLSSKMTDLSGLSHLITPTLTNQKWFEIPLD